MTAIRPFRALRYDPARVDLSRVIVPPYDVIAHDERADFYARDPHSAIRLELTRDVADEATTDYAEVARTLQAWRAGGVIVRDAEPAIYVMRQRFTAPGGERLERVGFFAELALEDYAARIVRPHERTMRGPKEDRLRVLRAARANLSSVFLLYEDRDQALAPVLEGALAPGDGVIGAARDDQGVEYTLAALRAPEAVARVSGFLRERPTVIADGHHRYETALAYRDEQRAQHGGVRASAPYESTLAYFANAYAPGSLLLAIHRVVRKVPAPPDSVWRARLSGWEHKQVEIDDPSAIPDLLADELATRADRPAFAADDASGRIRIFWKREPLGDDLVVDIVEREVIGGVFHLTREKIQEGALGFPKSATRAAEEVRSGLGTVALYLNPLTPDDVFRVTAAGEVMPQKSTFFMPKIPTGLVFRAHDEPEARA